MGKPKPAAPQIIMPPPPTPLPPAVTQENAKQLTQSQLESNPLLTKQAVDLQTQYAPQLAQSQYDIQAKYGPLYKALEAQLFPQQSQLSEQLSGQVSQRLGSPSGLTPEQQSAQDAIRQRQADFMLRNIRESANVGGTLYGGRRQQREDMGLQQLSQQYASEDIDRQMAARDQLLRELVPLLQMQFPQISQPSVPGFTQGVTPSGDALLSAMLGYQRPFVGFPGFAPQRNYGANVNAGPFGKIGGEAQF